MATSPRVSARTNSLSPSVVQSMCEERLLLEARSGHQAAFGELCERHAKKIFHTTFRLTRNREDAEDALQDSFLSAFVHLKNFDGRSAFSTWLTRIAINAALMKLRKNRSTREIALDNSAPDGDDFHQYEPADHHPDPEESYAQGERRRIVAGVVRGLRPAIRKVVEIRELQEHSMKETARMLGISVAATKGRLFHARAALRRVRRLKLVASARIRQAA